MHLDGENATFILIDTQQNDLLSLCGGVVEQNGFIVMSGEPGTGKTALLKQFRAHLEKRLFRTSLINDVAGPANALLAMIMTELGQTVKDFQTSHLLQQFHEYLNAQVKLRKQTVILIDNAENLSTQSLQVLTKLFQFSEDKQKLLHIILCGSVFLREKVSQPQNSFVRPFVRLDYTIRPLDETATKEFVHRYLQTQKCEVSNNSTKAVFEDVFLLSSGVLSTIIKYCDLIFNAAEISANQSINKDQYQTQPSKRNFSTFAEDTQTKRYSSETENRERMDRKSFIQLIYEKLDKAVLTTISASYFISAIIAMILFQQLQSDSMDRAATKAGSIEIARTSMAVIDHEKIPHESELPVELPVVPQTVSFKLAQTEETSVPDSIATPNQVQVVHNNLPDEIAAATSDNFATTLRIEPVSEDKKMKGDGSEFVSGLRDEKASPKIVVSKSELESIAKNAVTRETKVIRKNVQPVIAMIDNELLPSTTSSQRRVVDELALGALVAKFEVAYRYGDIPRLLDLLSDDVKSNQLQSKRNLRIEYQKLFSITEMRSMDISHMQWVQKGENIVGEGRFRVRVRQIGANNFNSYHGEIILNVARSSGDLLIQELHYNYSNLL